MDSSSSLMPWFDCARSYGFSEKFVGQFLRSKKVDPNDVYLSSKWGYTYVANWQVELEEGKQHEVKDHSVEVRIFGLDVLVTNLHNDILGWKGIWAISLGCMHESMFFLAGKSPQS